MSLQRFDGSEWENAVAERFDGSEWENAAVERFDGSEWVRIDQPAIPDSVGTHLDIWYPMDEGDGTTLNDSQDRQNATLRNSGVWVDDAQWWGDTAPELDGVDDDYLSDGTFSFTNLSMCGWFEARDISDWRAICGASDSNTDPEGSDAVWVNIHNDDTIFVMRAVNGSAGGVVNTNTTVSANTRYFVGVAYDGSDADLYLWDETGLLDSQSASSSNLPSPSNWYVFGGSILNDRFFDGYTDAHGFSDGVLSQTDFEEIWEDTR